MVKVRTRIRKCYVVQTTTASVFTLGPGYFHLAHGHKIQYLFPFFQRILKLLRQGQMECFVGFKVHQLHLIALDGNDLCRPLVNHGNLNLVLLRVNKTPFLAIKDTYSLYPGFCLAVFPRFRGRYGGYLARFSINVHIPACLQFSYFCLCPRHNYQFG